MSKASIYMIGVHISPSLGKGGGEGGGCSEIHIWISTGNHKIINKIQNEIVTRSKTSASSKEESCALMG